VNEAAATVPVTAGNVMPPVNVLVPAGANTTVPAVPATATLPKFMSTVLVILIGVTMVADAVAVAVACANDDDAAKKTIAIVAAAVNIFFTIFYFLMLFNI